MSAATFTWTSFYKRLCSISEIEEQPILQWMFGAMLFYFFVTFFSWISKSAITVEAAKSGAATCWPYFQSCTDFYFLHALPYGYSQTTLYMCFYALMMLIVYWMWKKEWVYAHLGMTLLFLWKMIVIFLLSYSIAGPYDYYHLFLTAVLLFIPYKEYFLKIVFVFLYFMSVTVKFSPAWIEGTYFSAMQTGIPLLPGWSTAIATNIVIFTQVVECWFLLSRNRILQQISFWYAIFFHLYSGILVAYDYPSVTLPAVAILFGPMYRHTPTPFNKKAIAGWVLMALFALFQLAGFLISPDRYLTLEGNRFGMWMFEANHQCIVTVENEYSSPRAGANDFNSPTGTPCNGFYCLVSRKTTSTATSSVQTLRYESGTAWNRCDPYEWWFQLHDQCSSSRPQIALQLDHSINGGPFYRIVDVPNICDVSYSPFSHNSWIELPPQAKIVGYPVENWYHY